VYGGENLLLLPAACKDLRADLIVLLSIGPALRGLATSAQDAHARLLQSSISKALPAMLLALCLLAERSHELNCRDIIRSIQAFKSK
jgi:hypothetical protein